jgi:hypothetical protein
MEQHYASGVPILRRGFSTLARACLEHLVPVATRLTSYVALHHRYLISSVGQPPGRAHTPIPVQRGDGGSHSVMERGVQAYVQSMSPVPCSKHIKGTERPSARLWYVPQLSFGPLQSCWYRTTPGAGGGDDELSQAAKQDKARANGARHRAIRSLAQTARIADSEEQSTCRASLFIQRSALPGTKLLVSYSRIAWRARRRGPGLHHGAESLLTIVLSRLTREPV